MSRRHPGSRSQQAAFTITEILIAVAIVGVLAAIALANYEKYVERTRVNQAIVDIASMSVLIVKYADDNRAFPETLADAKLGGRIDPWGRPYVYTDLTSVKGKGSARKDKRLNPLNSDFDLYSVGKDGDSRMPLAAKVSQDDVIRARDGRFVGLAKDFDP